MSDTDLPVTDWTKNQPGIAFQRCRVCAEVWPFERPHCPSCGSSEIDGCAAQGDGQVFSVTRVDRAPTPELKAHAPYTLVLVDMAEGFRIMAHGAAGLAIGDRVRASFCDFGGRMVPHFISVPKA
jgi:uncharacterized protein